MLTLNVSVAVFVPDLTVYSNTSVTITDVLPGELTFVSAKLNGEAITPAEGVYTVGNLFRSTSAFHPQPFQSSSYKSDRF